MYKAFHFKRDSLWLCNQSVDGIKNMLQVIQAGMQNLPRVPSLCLSSWLVWAGNLSSIWLSIIYLAIYLSIQVRNVHKCINIYINSTHSNIYLYIMSYPNSFTAASMQNLYIMSYPKSSTATSMQTHLCKNALFALVYGVRQPYLCMRTRSTLLVLGLGGGRTSIPLMRGQKRGMW